MKISQCDRIVDYINEFGSITALDAMREFGCMRLASRITDLKRQGYPVRREMITVKNRYDEPVLVARYSFAEVGNANNRV